jgi:hypothetical protein
MYPIDTSTQPERDVVTLIRVLLEQHTNRTQHTISCRRLRSFSRSLRKSETNLGVPTLLPPWRLQPIRTLVQQVSDWCSGAAAYFGWMREAKRENTRCGL